MVHICGDTPGEMHMQFLQEGCTIILQHICHLDMTLDIKFTNDIMLHKHALGMAVVYVV